MTRCRFLQTAAHDLPTIKDRSAEGICQPSAGKPPVSLCTSSSHLRILAPSADRIRDRLNVDRLSDALRAVSVRMIDARDVLGNWPLAQPWTALGRCGR